MVVSCGFTLFICSHKYCYSYWDSKFYEAFLDAYVATQFTIIGVYAARPSAIFVHAFSCMLSTWK